MPAVTGDGYTATGHGRESQAVDERLFGGVEVDPVYFLIGPEPGLVVSTGPTGTPPIQLPVGVTAGGAELFNCTTCSPSKPKCTELE
jgi:hypothetical protein